jgi:hypothetical protein
MRTTYTMTAVELGYCYKGSPICATEEGPGPDPQQLSYSPSTYPGARLPHLWRARGEAVHDLISPGCYALLKVGPEMHDTTAVERCAQARQVPLQVLELPEPTLRDVYERDLLLVRPDLHVAWRGNEVPANADLIWDLVTGQRGPTARPPRHGSDQALSRSDARCAGGA